MSRKAGDGRAARVVPWLVVLLVAGAMARGLVPPADAESAIPVHGFGRLPVVHHGRTKPFDSLARHSLMELSDRQTLHGEGPDGAVTRSPATRWLLDVMNGSEAAFDQKVFRITNDQLLGQLRLPLRPGDFKYSLAEIEPSWKLIVDRATAAAARPAEERDPFDAAVVELADHLQLFISLREWAEPHAVPPLVEGGPWMTFADGMQAVGGDPAAHPPLELLIGMIEADARGAPERFRERLDAYTTWLEAHQPEALRKARLETRYNHFAPFDIERSIAIYLVALLLACVAWFGFAARALQRTAVLLLGLGLVIHGAGIAVRIDLMGRPPVTNLYSSALFIGFAGVLLGLLLEWLWKNGFGAVIGGFIGMACLLVAFGLGHGSDTMEVLQAVLDTKFWLATHVICITLGYAATFVAGLLAALLILRGVLSRSLDRRAFQALGRMSYGVLCFATLLSFVGTVLGGIWADQSWGRFWGWDPKENGALMIVLWNALVLHARWGGLVATRGLAVLAVFGGVVTAWSWFGVNMLGVGLHSYGFMDQALFWLLVYVATQLAVMALGALPLAAWRSFREDGAAAAPSGAS